MLSIFQPGGGFRVMETMGDGNDGFQVTIMKWGDGGRVESFTLYTPEQRETPKVKS